MGDQYETKKLKMFPSRFKILNSHESACNASNEGLSQNVWTKKMECCNKKKSAFLKHL